MAILPSGQHQRRKRKLTRVELKRFRSNSPTLMKTKMTLLLAFLTALVLVAAGCASSKENQTIGLLKQAGFKAMSASTFEKQQKLKTLKADQLSTVKGAGGQIYYVYPLHAQNLLYVGRSAQYSAYQNRLQTQKAEAATLKVERSQRADQSWSQSVESPEGTDGSWEDVWSAPSD
jgi:hypothetical protein